MDMGSQGDERTAKIVLEADTKKYNDEIKKSSKETSKMAESIESLSKSFDGMYKKIGKKLIIFGAADLTIMSGMVAVSATLDKQMSSLAASSAAVGKSFDGNSMRDSIRSVSREVPIARGQIAALSASINKMGVDSVRQTQKMTDSFAKLQGATGNNSQQLAQSQIGLSKTFGNDTPSVVKANNDSLVTASAAANVDAMSTLGTAQQISTAAKTGSMSQQETIGMAAALNKAGPQGQQVAGVFSQLAPDLTKAQRTSSPQLKKYAQALGMSVKDVTELDTKELIPLLTLRTAGKGAEGRQILETLGLPGQSTQQALEGVERAGGVEKYMNISKDASASGSTEEAAKAAWNTLQDSMAKVRNNFTDLAQSMGQGLLPIVKNLADALAAFLEKFTPIAGVFLEPLGKIATALGGLSTALGGLLGTVTTLATPLLARRMLMRPANMLSRATGGSGEGGVAGLVKGLARRGTIGAAEGVSSIADWSRRTNNEYMRRTSIDDETVRGEKEIEKARQEERSRKRSMDRASKQWAAKQSRGYEGPAPRPYSDVERSAKQASKDWEAQQRRGVQGPAPKPLADISKPSVVTRTRSVGRDMWRAAGLGWRGGLSGTLSGLPEGSEEQAAAQAQPRLRDRLRGAYERSKASVIGFVGGSGAPAGPAEPPDPAKPSDRPSGDEALRRSLGVRGGQGPDPKGPQDQDRAKNTKEANSAVKKFTTTVRESTAKVKAAIQSRKRSISSMSKEAAQRGKTAATEAATSKQEVTVKMALIKATGSVTAAFGSLTGATARAAAVTGAGLAGAGASGIGKGLKGLGSAAIGMAGGPYMAAAGVAAGIGYMGWQQHQQNEQSKTGNDEEQKSFREATNAYASAVGEAATKTKSFGASLSSMTLNMKKFDDVLSSANDNKGKGEAQEDYTAPGAKYVDDKEEGLNYMLTRQAEGQMSAEKTEAVLNDLGRNPNLSKEDIDWIKKEYSQKTEGGTQKSAPSLEGQAQSLSDESRKGSGIFTTETFVDWFTGLGGPGATNEDSYYVNKYRIDTGAERTETKAKAQELATGINVDSTRIADEMTTGDAEKDKVLLEAAQLENTAKALAIAIPANYTDDDKSGGQALLNAQGMGKEVNLGETNWDGYSELKTVDERTRWWRENALKPSSQAKAVADVEIDFTTLAERSITILNEALIKEVEAQGGSSELATTFSDSKGTIQEALTTGLTSVDAQMRGQQELYEKALEVSGGDKLKAQRELQIYKDRGGAAGELASGAMSIGQHEINAVERPQLNRMGQMNADYAEHASILAEEDNPQGDKRARLRASTQKLEAGITQKYMEKLAYDRQVEREQEDFDIGRGHQLKDYERSIKRQKIQYEEGLEYSQIDYDIATKRSKADFGRGRRRSKADYGRSMSRGQEDYDRSMRRSDEDYQRSTQRAEEDFNRGKKRSEEDFNRSMLRGKKDFNRSRARSDEDYYKQAKRMAEDGAKSMYDPFARVFKKYTTDTKTLVENLKNQRKLLKEQKSNLEKARKMGLSDEAIDTLGLAESDKAQQLERLIQTGDSKQFKQINKEVVTRKDLVGDLQDESVGKKRMEEDRAKQIKRSEEDFKRSRQRSTEDFERSVNRSEKDFARSRRRSNADFARSISRSEKDFKRSRRRSIQDFARSLRRGEKDFLRSLGRSEKDRDKMLARQHKAHKRSLRWSLKDFNRNIARADKARALMIKRMNEDFIGLGTATKKTVAEMASIVAGGYEKSFGKMGARMAQVMRDTVKEINAANGELRAPTVPPEPKDDDALDKRAISNSRAAIDAQKQIRRQRRKRMAAGGIATGPTKALIGEAGFPEAVVPLNKSGARFMASMFKEHSLGRKQDRVAGRSLPGHSAASLRKVVNNNYDNSTNFNGQIHIQSQDPDDMAKKLKHRKKVRAIRSGSRDQSVFG